MKILIDAADAEAANEIIALLNGAAAATGKKKPDLVLIEDTNLTGPVRWGRDKPGIGYAFETLIIPLSTIQSLHIGQGECLQLHVEPAEFAILNTLLQKDLNRRPKAPF